MAEVDSKLARQRNKQANSLRITSEFKFCGKCKKTKAKTEFGPDAKRPDGLRGYCRLCKAIESQQYRQRNPEKSAEATKDWARRNPDKARAKMRRWQTKTHNRIHQTITSRMYAWLKNKNGKSTADLIGYGWEELKAHLERQFLPGMSWDNFGQWHIDHIVPLSSFKVSGIEDENIRRAWALSNLRPLWAIDNFRKNAKRVFLI